MTDGVATMPAAPGSLRQQADRFWQGRTARERQFVVGMTIVLLAFAVWLIFLQPALRSLHDSPIELDLLDQQLQQMQLAAVEMESFRGAPPVSPTQASSALRAATERLGSSAKLVLQGDRATLSFTGVAFEDLRAWLAETRSAARARPVEAQMLKASSGYSGSVTVVLGGAS